MKTNKAFSLDTWFYSGMARFARTRLGGKMRVMRKSCPQNRGWIRRNCLHCLFLPR